MARGPGGGLDLVALQRQRDGADRFRRGIPFAPAVDADPVSGDGQELRSARQQGLDRPSMALAGRGR